MSHNNKDLQHQVSNTTPFAQIPVWLIRGGKDVPPGAFRIYAAIKAYTKNGHNEAFPSQETLAKDMGVSSRQVRTYMQQLRDCGGVRYRLMRDSNGKTSRNYEYVLAWERPFTDEEYRKDTSGDSADHHGPPEESFRSTAEGNFRSNAEENFRLTTPIEHTPNISTTPHLGEVPLSSVSKLFVQEDENIEEDEMLHASRQPGPPPPDATELLDELWPERKTRRAS